LGCADCHAATVSADRTVIGNHTNSLLNIKFSGINRNGDSPTYNNSSTTVPTGATKALATAGYTCSNVYCHSVGSLGTAGNIVNAGGVKFRSVAWNGTGIGCDGCHGDQAGKVHPVYATGMAGYSTANSHVQHVENSAVSCDYCHNNTVTQAAIPPTQLRLNNYSGHLNRTVDIRFKLNGGKFGNYSAAQGKKTCSATACHGNVSPKWGANTTNNACTKCHGTPTASITAANRYFVAPPLNTAGTQGTLTGNGQVSNDPKVGAHQTHLRFLNGFSNYSTVDFRCEGCHGTLPTSGTHANGSSSPAFQGMATNRGARSPSFSATNLTCSNTYCHNPAGTGGTLNTANAGLAIQPSWSSASYLGDTAKTQANCNRCHKSPGDSGFTASFNHGATVIADDCSGCHGHNGNTAGIAGQRHLDGKKYGGGNCDSCHGYQVGSWAAKSERIPAVPEGKGAHEKHIAHLVARYSVTLDPATNQFGSDYAGSNGSWTNVCGVCHGSATHNPSEASGGTGRTISFAAGRQFGASAPVYNGVIGSSSSANPKTCSNISCHYFTTPVWSTY
jgi:predicted CxxxxCH...CXXCH cytochrome family protein